MRASKCLQHQCDFDAFAIFCCPWSCFNMFQWFDASTSSTETLAACGRWAKKCLLWQSCPFTLSCRQTCRLRNAVLVCFSLIIGEVESGCYWMFFVSKNFRFLSPHLLFQRPPVISCLAIVLFQLLKKQKWTAPIPNLQYVRPRFSKVATRERSLLPLGAESCQNQVALCRFALWTSLNYGNLYGNYGNLWNTDSPVTWCRTMPDASRRSIDPPALRQTTLWALGVATTVTVDRKESRARLTLKATNIAETSLTVDGIKYVIDTGRVLIANVGVVCEIDIDQLPHQALGMQPLRVHNDQSPVHANLTLWAAGARSTSMDHHVIPCQLSWVWSTKQTRPIPFKPNGILMDMVTLCIFSMSNSIREYNVIETHRQSTR